MRRKNLGEIEAVLARVGGEKICQLVSFKLQPSVASLLKKWGNPSGFVGQAVLEKLRRMLDDEPICGGCRFWSGRCVQGKLNRIAACPACDMYEPRVR